MICCLRSFAFLLALALVGCVARDEPPFPTVAARIPPVAADQARIYFYRDDEPYESLSRPSLYLNGSRAGTSIPGGVFYRDVAPGTYLITVDTDGIYWNPFKTVALRPGDTLYVKVESLSSWQTGGGANGGYRYDTFVVAIIAPDQATSDLAAMRYVAREAS
jgi:hypothetical protein